MIFENVKTVNIDGVVYDTVYNKKNKTVTVQVSLPSRVYAKDPIVTVDTNSVASFLRERGYSNVDFDNVESKAITNWFPRQKQQDGTKVVGLWTFNDLTPAPKRRKRRTKKSTSTTSTPASVESE